MSQEKQGAKQQYEIRDTRRTLRNLGGIVKEYKWGFILAISFSFISVIFQVLGPYFLGLATTEIFNGIDSGSMDIPAVVRILMFQAGAYVGSALFSYFQSLIMANVTQRLMFGIRERIQGKLDRLPLSYFDTNTLGDVLSRVTNDTETLSLGLQQGLPTVFVSAFTVIMILVAMLQISIPLTFIGLLTLPLSFLSTVQIMKRSQPYFRGQQVAVGDLTGYIEEMIGGHDVVRAYGQEKETVEKFDTINDDLYDNASRAAFSGGLMRPMTSFFGNIGYVLVAVLGGYQVLAGNMGVGQIQSFIQYLRMFSQPINQVSNVLNEFQATMAASERVFDFLEEPEESPDTENPLTITSPTGQVEMKNVRFGYRPTQPLITDLSIELNSGDMVALVGPTGAGKTTLVNLLLRFYDIQGGQILIDGVDIMKLTRHDLRSMFGMVLQDTWLYSASIADNIRYGKLDATDEEVVQAAQAAYADAFIRTLPGGYDMILGEDAETISGGQRQLITIARALLSDPTIMILDEATSSVDTRTEVLIQKAMKRLLENRTSFVIAHRLSTIRDADTILVLNHGDIVESGTHDQLLEKDGFYADLYYSQLAGEMEA